MLLGACGGDATTSATTGGDDAADETTTTTSADGATSTSATSTLAGVEAAQWSDTITLTVADDSFTFESSGIPDHELPDQFLIPNDGNMPPFTGDDIAGEFSIVDTDGLIVESPIDTEITLFPEYSDEVTETSLGMIGVTISGAPLFNDYEDMTRQFVALDDNLSLDGVFFIDACNGHPLASGQSYHYHGIPYCVTDGIDVAGDHSTILGVLLDGFPIYGNKDVDGTSITNDELDECSGHVGATPEFPDGIYHYHLTEDANPYSIDCYHGEIDPTATNAGGPGGGGPPTGGPPQGAGGPPAALAPEEDT